MTEKSKTCHAVTKLSHGFAMPGSKPGANKTPGLFFNVEITSPQP